MMSRLASLLFLSFILALISCDAFAQRSIGAGSIVLDDGAGHTITLQAPSGMSSSYNYLLPAPPAGSTSAGFVDMGSVTGQTLYWNGTAWVPSVLLVNNNSNLGLGFSSMPGSFAFPITLHTAIGPDADNTLDLGDATHRFGTIYATNIIGPAGFTNYWQRVGTTLSPATSGDVVSGDGSGLTNLNPANLSTAVAIANGGTGATSASAALNNLLPTQGAPNAGKVLSTNGTTASWISVSGTGTVTSVDVSGGTTGLTTSGGPVTGSGTITLSGKLIEANGGTNQSTYTAGDILYASAANTLSKLAVGSSGQVLTVQSGLPAWVTGGAGMTNPMTTLGDIMYEDNTPAPARLAGNATATKKFLTQTGTGSASAAPVWATIAASDVPTLNQSTTGSAASFTGSLSGDVTGTQSATVVSSVGGSSATNVHAAELLANAATSANTASTIVKRDASGNFSAGTVTANLSGNATTATSATSFSGSLSGDVTGTQSATVVSSVGGSSAANVHATELLANAATNANTASTIVRRDASGNFTAGTITATLSGNASTATTATNFSGSLSGDVTGTQGATVVSSVGGSSATNVHTAELLANAATNANTASTIVKRDASGNFTAGTITATLSGNASTATTATSFSGSLSGDVTGTQGATVVSSVGGSSATNVHAAELLANAATNANTASTIVKRDASGNFSAGTITGTLSGNATNVSGIIAAANGGTGTATTSANTVFAGPTTGIATTPAFRSLVAADIPSLSSSYINNNSTLQTASFNISGNGLIGGSVGIGTTSPQTLMHVWNTAAANASGQEALRISSSYSSGTPGSGGFIRFTDLGNGTVGEIHSVHESAAAHVGLSFWTLSGSTAERMRILSTGNVGIGTANPQDNLEVVGSSNVLRLTNSAAASQAWDFGFDPNATSANHGNLITQSPWDAWNVYLNTDNNVIGGGAVGFRIFANGAIGSASQLFEVVGTGVANATTGFQINGAAASGNYLRGDGTNYVSSAIQATDIPGGSTNYIQNSASLQSSSNFNISGNGYIGGSAGVGTTSPGAKIDVQAGSGTIPLNLYQAAAFSATPSFVQYQAGTSATTIGYTQVYSGTGELGIQGINGIALTAGSTGVGTLGEYITAAGLVGIGTTTPTSSLEVVGASNSVTSPIAVVNSTGSQIPLTFNSGSTQEAYVKGDNGGNLAFGAQSAIAWESGGFGASFERMRIASDGKIGIGTTSPSQQLEVKSGNVLLSNAGTAGQLQLQGTSSGVSTIAAGAQGTTTINYTLPTSQPTANQVLTASSVSGSGPYNVALGWATASGGSTPLFVSKSADQAYTTTSLTSDSHLALSLAANATYMFDGFLAMEDSNQDMSAGAKLAFTVPSGATVKWGVNSAGGPMTTSKSIANTSGGAITGIGLENAALGDENFVYVKGIVITGSISGNLQLQCAKGNGTKLKVHQNSYITATRVQ